MKLNDYRALRRAIATAEVEAARDLGLPRALDVDRLLVVWDEFVRDVNVGYWGSAYDYCHALDIRDQLEAVLQRLDDPALDFVRDQAEPLDAALLASTTADTRVFNPSDYSEPGAGWWWTRCPVNLGQLSRHRHAT